MKKAIKCIVLSLGILFIVSVLILISFVCLHAHDNSKKYAHIINSNTKVLYEYFQSDFYNFNDYYKEYNLPKSGVIYLSGTFVGYDDIIIEPNEYCSQSVSIRKEPSGIESKILYWTIKIVDGEISELWLHAYPLGQEMLKEYEFDEQVEMMPLLTKDRFKYAIGYYKVSEL